ncbi:MAG: DUF58 domain-containing protein [Verrucomicrobiota bacterium]
MIVPRSRLLFWVALVVLPFATLAGVAPNSAPLAIALIALFFVIALFDAVFAYGTLDKIKINLPKVVRLSKDRESEIEILINNEQQQSKQLRLALALPAELHSTQEKMLAQLPKSSATSRITWPCIPQRRGNYILDKCYLQCASALGFWSVRDVAPVQSEIRVYPNLMSERKNVATLFLNRGSFGAHAQRQVGKGRDFEKLREYIPGDSYDEIHWKATAKRGKPVTKIFQIERTQEVYVIIDASRLSARDAATLDPKSKAQSTKSPLDEDQLEPSSHEPRTSILERYITAALVLGLAAEQQNDLFGLITFSDKVQKFVRAKNGKAHFAACRDALYTLHPQIVTPDFDELCTIIRLRLRRRALLIFLTALDDPALAENFVRNMDLICRQHLVLVNVMQPPGAKPVFSDPNIVSLDEIYQQLGGHILWNNLRELEKTLQHRGVRFSLVNNEKLSAQLVTQYLSVKRRQLI